MLSVLQLFYSHVITSLLLQFYRDKPFSIVLVEEMDGIEYKLTFTSIHHTVIRNLFKDMLLDVKKKLDIKITNKSYGIFSPYYFTIFIDLIIYEIHPWSILCNIYIFHINVHHYLLHI